MKDKNLKDPEDLKKDINLEQKKEDSEKQLKEAILYSSLLFLWLPSLIGIILGENHYSDHLKSSGFISFTLGVCLIPMIPLAITRNKISIFGALSSFIFSMINGFLIGVCLSKLFSLALVNSELIKWSISFILFAFVSFEGFKKDKRTYRLEDLMFIFATMLMTASIVNIMVHSMVLNSIIAIVGTFTCLGFLLSSSNIFSQNMKEMTLIEREKEKEKLENGEFLNPETGYHSDISFIDDFFSIFGIIMILFIGD